MSMVKINNLNKVEKLFLELLPKHEKVLDKNGLAFMKSVRRTAKLMAPKDTGRLADSIRLKPTKIKGKTKQYLLEVTAPHAGPQEFGFTPHPFLVDPGRPGFQTNKLQKFYGQVIWVKKNTPFVKPAIERNISRFLQNLNTGIKGVLKA